MRPETLRRLHALYADLDDPFLRGADGPWDMFVRISYEQGGWQGAVYSGLARFVAMLDREFGKRYDVLSRGTLGELLGADPDVYSGASMLFTVGACRNSGWFDLGWLEQPQFAEVVQRIPVEALRRVFARSFGAPCAVVAGRARANRNPDPNLRRHDPNPLAATPYVEMRPGVYLAPSPRLVAQRASLNAVYHLGQQRWGDRFTRASRSTADGRSRPKTAAHDEREHPRTPPHQPRRTSENQNGGSSVKIRLDLGQSMPSTMRKSRSTPSERATSASW